MSERIASTAPSAIDAYVTAFEKALKAGRADLRAYLPSPIDPSYRDILRELIRAEIAFGWSRGKPRRVAEYCQMFPEIVRDSDLLGAIAFEEFKERLDRGERPNPQEYTRQYGIDVRVWYFVAKSAPKHPQNRPAADSDTVLCFGADGDQSTATDMPAPPETSAAMPKVGGLFLGFRLVAELGRGAVGRVFLARQSDLANRPVVLKITSEVGGESQTLARLQHANIVPVYSLHHSCLLQATCMPYYGSTTLFHVIERLRQMRSRPTSGRFLVETLDSRRQADLDVDAPPTVTAGAGETITESKEQPGENGFADDVSRALLEKIEALSYCDAALWLSARVAEGLAHAHDRGIVHMDLKPANILLSDEGRPMLLDFDLSADARRRALPLAEQVGGTLAYMSPEQLDAFGGKRRDIDARSDVYSLGLILYELLTGESPGQPPTGHSCLALPVLAEYRMRSLPAHWSRGAGVSPAVESIVRKCLAYDPAGRYRSAHELVVDIDRHLAHQPLRHAANPSLAELIGKLSFRHPKLTSKPALAITATLIIAVGGVGGFAFWEHRTAETARIRVEEASADALRSWKSLQSAADMQQALGLHSDPSSLQRVAAVSRQTVAAYDILDNPKWLALPRVALLDAEERTKLPQLVAHLLVRWADAEMALIPSMGDKSVRLALASKLNEAAEAALGNKRAGKALAMQKAAIAELTQRADAGILRHEAEKIAIRSPIEHFEEGRRLFQKQDYRGALPQFEQATRLDPQSFWAWQYLGECREKCSDQARAAECYTKAIGLAPSSALAYFPYSRRAEIYHRSGKLPETAADLDRAEKCLSQLPVDLRDAESAAFGALKAELLK